MEKELFIPHFLGGKTTIFGNVTKNGYVYIAIFGNVTKNGYVTKMTTLFQYAYWFLSVLGWTLFGIKKEPGLGWVLRPVMCHITPNFGPLGLVLTTQSLGGQLVV